MTVIIWGLGALVVGSVLGILGFFYSKAAYTLFTIAMGVIGFLAVNILPASTAVSGPGLLKQITFAIDAMGYLPDHMQSAIVLFIAAFFLARICVWWYRTFRYKPVEETTDRRRARILKDYGFKTMEELRDAF